MFNFFFWSLVLILGVIFTFWGWLGRKREAELKNHLLGRVPSVTITKPSLIKTIGSGEIRIPITKCQKCGVEFENGFTLRVPFTAVGLIAGYAIGASLEPTGIFPTILMMIANRYFSMIAFGILGNQVGRRYGRCNHCGTFQLLGGQHDR